jgi:hypothetical protein
MKHEGAAPFSVWAKGGREGVTDPIRTAGLPCFGDSSWHRYYGVSSRAEPAGSLANQAAQSRDPYSVDIKSRWEGVSQEKLPRAAASAQRDARSLDSGSRAGAWSPSLGMTVRKVKKRKQLLRCAQDFGRRLRRRQIASTSTPRCDSQASHTAALRMTEGKGWLSAGGRWLSALRRVAQPFPCSRSTSHKSHTRVHHLPGRVEGNFPTFARTAFGMVCGVGLCGQIWGTRQEVGERRSLARSAPRACHVSATPGWQRCKGMSSRAEAAGSLANQPAQSRGGPEVVEEKPYFSHSSQSRAGMGHPPD